MGQSDHLSHIKGSLPNGVVMHTVSFYIVALEAWRRGLKVKYYNRDRGGRVPSLSITYSISDGENEYHFVCARGTKTTKEAIVKAENKSSAYKYMKKNGVPTPESETFDFRKSSIDEMCDYGESIGYPLVIKPTNRGGGRGVVTHINSRSSLRDSIVKVKNEFDLNKIIIEKYFEGGVDHRFYVIEDTVIAVTKNYASNVIGDGESNLEHLIKKRNIEIKKNAASKNRIIKIDDDLLEHLSSKGLSLSSVPKKSERIFLRKHGTHLGRRLSVDCTDTIDPKFKDYAVKAINSVSGLPTGSVDMIINEETNKGIVNEINTKGEIMMQVLPVEGSGRDIPKHLIDYYFPDTEKINNNFYFEFEPIKDLFLTGYADEVTIPMYPTDTQYKKDFIVEGERMGPMYLKKLKKKAANLYLIGKINQLSKKRLEVTAIGDKRKINELEQFMNNSGTAKTKIKDVTSSEFVEFNGKSGIGFECIEGSN